MNVSKGLILTGSVLAMLAGCTQTFEDDCNNLLYKDGTSCTVVENQDPASEDTQLTSNSATISRDFTSVSYDDNGTADPSDDTMTFVGGDFDDGNAYVRDPANDRAGMLAFRSDFTTQGIVYFATRGVTPSGQISVQSNITPNYSDEGDYIVNVTRSGPNTAPNSGNATYVGRYAGSATVDGGGGGFLSEGDAIIFVEFQENGRAYGFVQNRTVLDNDTTDTIEYSYGNNTSIVLNESDTTGDGLLVNGTTSVFEVSGSQAGSGTYAGVVGGPNGSEIGVVTETTDTIIGTDTSNNGTRTFQVREFGIITGQCINGLGLTCDPN